MALWSWWRGDPLPPLAPLPAFRAAPEHDAEALVRLTGLEPAEVTARLEAGHRAYIARLGGVAVASGWVATLAASIGELELAFAVTSGDRYLWDFVTLADWRGRGIYPRLLQAILAQEAADARRFWVINAPENAASAAGIAKAGFRPAGELSFRSDRGVGSVPTDATDRARVGASLLGVPLLEAVREGRVLAPCWRCVLAAKPRADTEAACWPYRGGIAVECSCA